MEQHWLIIERFDNWDADRTNGFTFFGLPDRHRNAALEIKKGDKVYCYVSSKISAFSDIRIVLDAGLKKINEDSFEDIYDRSFPYYFTTAPMLVLPREKWVPVKQLASLLELTRGRTEASHRALFQTSIRKLSPGDAAVISNVMRRAAEKGRSRKSHL
jgi:EVE domain-containing protein